MVDRDGLEHFSSKRRLFDRLGSTPPTHDTGLSKLLAPSQPARRLDHEEVRHAFTQYRECGVAGETAKRICLSLDTSELARVQKRIQEGMFAKLGSSLAARKKSGDSAPSSNLDGLSEYSIEFALRVNPVDALMHFLEHNNYSSALRDVHLVLTKSLAIDEDKFKADRPQQYALLSQFQELIKLDVELLLGKREDKQAVTEELYQKAKSLYTELLKFKKTIPSGPGRIR